jgi:hypothetical protein
MPTKTYTPDELKVILDAHYKWLKGQDGGSRADLTGAVLTRADLTGAVLTRADLTRADLTRAVLTGAVLTGAVLTGAVLTGAVLTGAVLTDAVLTGAVLTDAVERLIKVPSLHRRIVAAIDAGGALNMGDWHSCETTHCRAGWAVHLAGPAGAMLEAMIGPAAAGALIHVVSCPALNGKVPNFYNQDNKAVLEEIRQLAEMEEPLEAASA